MARGVNKVFLIGNVGVDPEIRYTQNQNPVANLRMATSEKYKGEERTEWHNVVAFGKLAEIIEQYVRKGSKIFIEGKLQTRKWQDKSGNDRYSTEIVAWDMQMLDGKGGGDAAPRQETQEREPGSDDDKDELNDDIPW